MKNYHSLPDALSDLKEKGYEADFETTSFCLYCGDLDIRLNPGAYNVDETYLVEGDSNPDDDTIVYAISSCTGVKGTIVDAYETYSEYLNFEMARELRDQHLE